MKWMTADERAAWETMLAEAHGDPSNGGKTTKVMAARLHRMLLDAEQAHHQWAASVLEDATVDGLHTILKASLKRQSVVLVSHDGSLVGKATRVGVRRKRADGVKVWQQALFHDLTWVELSEWLDGIRTQVGALLVNVDMADRLFQLQELSPESTGPGDACKRLGTTVPEWLSEAA